MKTPILFKTLDVRHLLDAGREPLPEIRRSIEALGPGEGLEIIAPFLPSPLIELLGSEGFDHDFDHEPGGPWITRFWRPDARA
ncbi:MAG: DUF2249 domain-containing protein [Verrucomicrobiales bacterium]